MSGRKQSQIIVMGNHPKKQFRNVITDRESNPTAYLNKNNNKKADCKTVL